MLSLVAYGELQTSNDVCAGLFFLLFSHVPLVFFFHGLLQVEHLSLFRSGSSSLPLVNKLLVLGHLHGQIQQSRAKNMANGRSGRADCLQVNETVVPQTKRRAELLCGPFEKAIVRTSEVYEEIQTPKLRSEDSSPMRAGLPLRGRSIKNGNRVDSEF